ncbi:hypothetical protein L1049_028077 [Liquidambar formosana]|uniref:Uncharacterized protein n=1 Tax=Liquidambar formosana TaxID=63359 RepID=A0AAP0RKC5_LIQFO
MVMNVEIISKETIKPSSPTPHHLTELKLSLLDQIAPPIFVPLIFFYHPKWDSSINHSEKSCLVKKSLSETLTRFYPLAGTLKEDFYVDCNDEGVEYFEACIAGELSEAIKKPDKKILGQFLPFEPYGKGADSGRQVLLAAQFNMFTCGGVAIGVCISHKIADGNSATRFVKAWADTASRGDNSPEAMHPSFDAVFHFPPKDISGIMPTTGITTKDNIVSRSFVFDKSSITALREKAKAISADGSSQANQPTRAEAVSAFLWKRFMVMALSKSVKAKAKVFAALHAVNLRERMVPPLPVHSFGNLSQVAIAPTTVEVEKDYHFLAAQLRNAIRGINGDYVKKLHDGDVLFVLQLCFVLVVVTPANIS